MQYIWLFFMSLKRCSLVTWMCFCALILLPTIEANVFVHMTNGSTVELDSVEIIYYGGSMDLIQTPISFEVSNRTDDVSGKCFIIRSALAVDNQALKAQNNGAEAVIAITPVYYIGGFLKYRVDNRTATALINIPIVEIPLVAGRTLWSLFLSDQIVNVTILPKSEENPWSVVFLSPAFYFWTVSLVVYSLVDISLAIWKIVTFSRKWRKFHQSVALCVLLLEVLSNLLRIVALVDIFGVFNIYTEQVFAALTELSFPIVLSSYMLFILYWHEMMTNSSVVVHPFIVKMRIPFFVTSAVLLLLQIVRTILRNTTTLDNLSFITAFVYLVVTLALNIFYAVTGGKLLKRLQKSKSLGSHVRLRRSTVKILIGDGILVAFLIVALLFATGSAYTPIGCLLVWYIFYTLFAAASLMNILAFELPSRGKSSGSGPNNSSGQTNSETGSNLVIN